MAYSIGEDYSGVSVLDKAIRVIKGMPSMSKGQSKCDLPQGDTSEVAVNERRSGRLSHGFTEDAISRKEALKCINDTLGDYFILNELYERIDKLPSVTHKSGKWIIRDDLSTVRYYQCSECNEIDLDYSDYCPNCGAKMESEVNNG